MFTNTDSLRLYSPDGYQYLTQDQQLAESRKLREEKQRREAALDDEIAEQQQRLTLAQRELENERNQIREIIAKVRRNRTDAEDVFRQIGLDPSKYE